MTGGQNYVVFWTLRPNLSSRLGRVGGSCPSADDATATAAESSPEAERAPASNETVSEATKPSVFSSAEKAMAETFTCGVAIGYGGGKAGSASAGGGGEGAAGVVVAAVTGTASGAIAVWENFECVKMVLGVHGTYLFEGELGRGVHVTKLGKHETPHLWRDNHVQNYSQLNPTNGNKGNLLNAARHGKEQRGRSGAVALFLPGKLAGPLKVRTHARKPFLASGFPDTLRMFLAFHCPQARRPCSA